MKKKQQMEKKYKLVLTLMLFYEDRKLSEFQGLPLQGGTWSLPSSSSTIVMELGGLGVDLLLKIN